MTPQTEHDLGRIDAQVQQLRADVEKLDGFVDEVRMSLSEIKGSLDGALKVSATGGRITGAIVTAVIAIVAVLISWFKK